MEGGGGEGGEGGVVYGMCVCFCVYIAKYLLRPSQELCESRGGRPGLSVLNEPSGFRGRKVLLNHASALVSACP